MQDSKRVCKCGNHFWPNRRSQYYCDTVCQIGFQQKEKARKISDARSSIKLGRAVAHILGIPILGSLGEAKQ